MRIHLDEKERVVSVNGRKEHLTPKEYGILSYLMQEPGKTHTAEEIYRNAWQEEPYDCRLIVSVHIRHIREKIEVNPSRPVMIKALWGRGYCYAGR